MYIFLYKKDLYWASRFNLFGSFAVSESSS